MSKTIDRVLALFDEINRVPRQSGHLEKIHPWLMNWAQTQGFRAESDGARNIVIRVPATTGYEKAPTLILQAHMDMVCEKGEGVKHDFKTDPILSWRDGEWLRARGTSLGADNGIALALFFDLITDEERKHPALEILITTDEETGLVGAQKLEPGFVSGSVLLNLDSEDEGVFTIGCAGGMDTHITLPLRRKTLPSGYKMFTFSIGGLMGGHSGTEIHLGRASANVLLVRALKEVADAVDSVRFGGLHGGTTHNAIAREAQGLIAVPADQVKNLEEFLSSFASTVKAENAAREQQLTVTFSSAEAASGDFFHPEDGRRIVDALRLVSHGVKNMSTRWDGMVETSMNFAVLRTKTEGVSVLTNQRSAVMSRGRDLSETMFSLARLYGGSYGTGNHYPAWEPQSSSKLLDRCLRIWKELYSSEAEVEVTHAGLECGAIGARVPGLDMISFGPTIMQPHSPDERLFIPSVGRVRDFFRALLKSF